MPALEAGSEPPPPGVPLAMTQRLYLWKTPRDLDAGEAAALVKGWLDAGGDPRASPFRSSTDMGWFYRELTETFPGLDVTSDAVPSGRRTPIWMSGEDEPPARVVAIRLEEGLPQVRDEIYGLAAKYDLVLFDARSEAVHHPLEELAEYASATFWPAGLVRSLVAGAIGVALAAIAWFLGIPLLSGLLILVGAFIVVLVVVTFIHESRVAIRKRRSPAEPPPTG